MSESAAPVVVTGATGQTGQAVRALLARHHVPVRPLSRTPAADEDLFVVDPLTGAGLDPALDGAAAVYLMAPNLFAKEVAWVDHVLCAASRHGVGRVVYHSVMHPHCEAMPHHLRKATAEDHVRRSGLDWTILQPAAYHQNLLRHISAHHLEVPYDPTRTFTNVDLHDVAQVAVQALTSNDLSHATCELAGPERHTVHDLATTASHVLDRPITARQVPVPPHASPELRAMFAYYDRHGFSGHPGTVTQLLGRAPRTWAQALTDSPQKDTP